MKTITFVVEGTGSFPTDMLRYDSAWPASESASSVIDGHRQKGRREVILRSVKFHGPSEDRWRSFLWRVIPGSVRED